ncbi:hypothetical protein PIB30_021362 [Stylosanthes scabra]|uniref:Secreted protein n=1 Tax=Stylosanthes scabra TaxID=79078 RepID=A0ABU6R958_9FABA|nr:hypothetical protein [Stylosanthes scabra]
MRRSPTDLMTSLGACFTLLRLTPVALSPCQSRRPTNRAILVSSSHSLSLSLLPPPRRSRLLLLRSRRSNIFYLVPRTKF